MSRHMEELKDMLCEELDRIAMQGELTAGSLETIDKLTHSIKSIDTIMAMEDSGYSRYDGRTYGGMSRRKTGRNSYRYSRDDGREKMIERLEDMMNEAKDSQVRAAIQEAIHQIGE